MVRAFKPIANLKSSHYGITKIFSDDLILAYNWDGAKNKAGLRNLPNFNYNLFGKCFF